MVGNLAACEQGCKADSSVGSMFSSDQLDTTAAQIRSSLLTLLAIILISEKISNCSSSGMYHNSSSIKNLVICNVISLTAGLLLKIVFFPFCFQHMLWVVIRTISMSHFFFSTQNICLG